ncbi:MAG: lytic transglycosylase domain-containing protein [Myxococcales bacterium]|nr:lytic transglycosylase domain-containing protein [Myxococcales bacterium]MCB9625769.1 lytic transglycosylase domain-containing protein [Sandaracinaceae bacterium]
MLSPSHVRLCLTTVAALCALAPGDVSADIYECRRADGSTHYTNAPAGERNCRVVVHGSDRPRTAAPDRPAMEGASDFQRPSNANERSSDPGRYTRYDAYIREASQLYQLPESFVRAVVRVESDFNPNVVSNAGAMGLMQLMPSTARSMGVRDPFDPRQNILGGTRYLRVLANSFNGDLVLTVAAYNAGGGAVTRYRGVPPYAETRRYVQRVLRHYYAYRSGRVEAQR